MKGGSRWATVLGQIVVSAAVLVAPLGLMLAYSFSRFVPGRITDHSFTLANYARLFADLYYVRVVGMTLEIGVLVTAISLVIGYPLAHFLARTNSPWRALLSYLIFVPLMMGIVVRAYGWIVILGREGLINSLLVGLHITNAPLQLLFTKTAVVLGLVEVLLPFAVMPLIAAIEKIDPGVEEAARALGATGLQTFLRVTLPLSKPGLLSGGLLVFSLSISAYALPALLGGAKVKMMSGLAYDAMLVAFNYPFGSAIGMLMVALATVVIFLYLRSSNAGRERVP